MFSKIKLFMRVILFYILTNFFNKNFIEDSMRSVVICPLVKVYKDIDCPADVLQEGVFKLF